MARRRQKKSIQNEGLLTLALLVLVVMIAAVTTSSSSSSLPYLILLVIVVVALIGGLALYQYSNILKKRKAMLRLSLDQVDSMNGLDFERYVGELLRAQGYRITFTPINDYGVDIIALKDGLRTAIQTKRYAKPVGLSAVQEACAGMAQHKCSRAMVVTNNSFTKAARQLAKSNHCELIGREQLAAWVNMAKEN